jgi:hypothetical protein
VGCADGQKALFVQRAQHACLRLEAHVADLVEEERAAVGSLERPALFRGRAGWSAGHGPATIAE